MRDYVNSTALQEYTTKLVAKLKTLFPGTPTAAATVADMTDHSKTYVYVGSETGYTAGDWYYWDGSAWTSGGPFQATSIITDTTLAVAGEAADAKATGDAIAAAKTAVLNAMAPAYSTSATYAVGDYVNYNGGIYRCTTAITTAESWTVGHWTAVTLGADLEGQVSDLKTQLGGIVTPTTNLVTLKNMSTGVITSTGDLDETKTNYKTTDFIPVTPRGEYYFKGFQYVAIYNENKTFRTRWSVTSSGVAKTFNSTDFYIRTSSYSPTADWQINAGDTELPYMPPDVSYFDEDISIEKQIDKTLTVEDKAADAKSTGDAVSAVNDKIDSVAHKSTNLVTLENLSKETVIAANGDENYSASYNTSDFIPVYPNTTYYIIGTPYVATYNAEKTFRQRLSATSSGGTFTTDALTHYLKISSNKDVNTWQINVGDESQNYEKPDATYLNDNVIITKQLEDLIAEISKVTNKHGVAFTPSLPYSYDGSTIVPFSGTGHLADLYALWHQLAVDFPQYVQETVLGKDASNTYDIFSYRIDNGASFAVRLPRIVWISNIHGNEEDSAISTYYMIKSLLEDFATDPTCYSILSAARLYVIPIMNPYGFENDKRVNANNVNLNRNFPVDWMYRDPNLPYGETKYGIMSASNGSNPYYYYGGGSVVYDDATQTATVTYIAEPETTLIVNYINSLNTGANSSGKIMFAVNKHDAGAMSTEAALIYVEDNYEGDRELLTTLGNWMKPHWMATQNWLTQKNGVNFSTVKAAATDDPDRAGTMDKWFNYNNIHGCLLEIPPVAGSTYTDPDHHSDLCKVNVDYCLTMLANIISKNSLLNNEKQTYTYELND